MTTRKQIAAAFKAAKRHLQGPCRRGEELTKTHMICYALNQSERRGQASRKTIDAAKRVIMRRLSPCFSCGTWLQNTQGVPARHLTFNNLQAYRHRWLDALIEEFSQPEKKP